MTGAVLPARPRGGRTVRDRRRRNTVRRSLRPRCAAPAILHSFGSFPTRPRDSARGVALLEVTGLSHLEAECVTLPCVTISLYALLRLLVFRAATI
jgi:hypothetical protein